MASLLKALVELVEEIEVVGTPRRIFSNFLSGFSEAPVRLHPRAEAVEAMSA